VFHSARLVQGNLANYNRSSKQAKARDDMKHIEDYLAGLLLYLNWTASLFWKLVQVASVWMNRRPVFNTTKKLFRVQADRQGLPQTKSLI
jgi:hypothetical protein